MRRYDDMTWSPIDSDKAHNFIKVQTDREIKPNGSLC